jgi:hypothetical protein
MNIMRIKHWGLGLIIGIWLIFSSPYLFKGLVPFPSDYLVSFFPPWSASYGMPVKNNAMPDIITQIYPWKMITIDAWMNKEVPLWNPHSFAGTPHAANYQSAIFSPLNVLFFIFSRIDAWSVLVLLQPLLAGIGMYMFLRVLERSMMAATMGAIAFMFCGFMTVWMAYATLGYAALCLPYAFLGIALFMRTFRWWHLLLVGGAIAVSFLSGHFQISLYVLGATLAYAASEGIRTYAWKRAGLIVVAVLCGLAIAAPQLALTFEAYMASVRSDSFVKGEIIPWQYIFTFLSPDFYGNPVTRNDWFGHYAEWAGFVGVIPFLLAVSALLHKKGKEAWFFMALVAVAFVLAFPTPFSDMLFALTIPVLSTSAASRIMILWCFALCVLAAYGLDFLRQAWKTKDARFYRRCVLGLGIALVIGWIILLLAPVLPSDKLAIGIRNSILPTVMIVAAMVLSMMGFLTIKRISLIAAGVLVVLTSIDMLRFATKWMPFSSRDFVYPTVSVLTFLQQQPPYARMFGNLGGEVSVAGVNGIEGYDAMYQKRYGEFLSSGSDGTIKRPERSVALLGKGGSHAQRILDLLGVSFIVHRLSDGRNVWAYPHWNHPQYESVYKDEHYEVLYNRNALPRFFLAQSYEIIEDDQSQIDRLLSDEFDATSTVILQESPSLAPQPGDGSLSIVRYSANSMTIETEAMVPKLLFVSDTYDAGWRARIDGKESPIYRANFDFRAISVPEGKHTIVMYYWPRSFTMSLGVTIVGIVGFVVLIVVRKRYENRHL